MCRVLEVSPAGYHAWAQRSISAHELSDQQLLEAIQRIVRQSHGRYGSPRVHQQLRAEGLRVARKRVARLMREHGLSARPPRRRVRTTDSRHGEPVAENLLRRNFSAEAGNQKWVSDITYIPTCQGWLYLAVVIDLFSRRVIGWSMSQQIDQSLVERAVTMAITQKPATATVLLHSDRGSQYAARATRELCARHAITQSMSRRGNCWDNAVSESFFSTLKRELIGPQVYATAEDARGSIFEYIEAFYNRERRHSSVGYLSPIDFELAHTTSIPCPL
jgi:putative transposase